MPLPGTGPAASSRGTECGKLPEEDALALQLLALFAAFWVAVIGYAGRQPDPRWDKRFLAGLVLGAALGHWGWLGLHLPAALEDPWGAVFSVTGLTLIPVPLGLLLTAPWGAGYEARTAYWAAALGSLPLAFAVARLGCLAAGCCHGTPTEVAWGLTPSGASGPVHPTPIYEIAGWIALWLAMRGVPDAWVPSTVLAGFGTIRLIVEPWRAPSPLGDPVTSPELLAAIWIAVGCLVSPLGQGFMAALASTMGKPGSCRLDSGNEEAFARAAEQERAGFPS